MVCLSDGNVEMPIFWGFPKLTGTFKGGLYGLCRYGDTSGLGLKLRMIFSGGPNDTDYNVLAFILRCSNLRKLSFRQGNPNSSKRWSVMGPDLFPGC